MLKVIFKIVLMFVGFCVMVAVCVPMEQTTQSENTAKSKYLEFTLSQAKLKIDLGQCKTVTGTVDENNFKVAIVNGMGTIRVYEPVGNSRKELLSAINSYVELDNANAYALYEAYGKYAFTTMRCN
jgi:hypothetical protein